MQEMMKMYNMYGMDPSMFGGKETLVLNANNELVQYIAGHKDSDKIPMICQQLYDLAMISHKPLAPEEMTQFITRSKRNSDAPGPGEVKNPAVGYGASNLQRSRAAGYLTLAACRQMDMQACPLGSLLAGINRTYIN